MSDSYQSRINFEKTLWLGVACVLLFVASAFLASRLFFFVFATAGLAWLILLPYHSLLSIILAISTFASALIIPFLPGRPFVWEFAAMLAWSGLVVTISMRRYAPDFGEVINRHRFMFFGVICYCVVLLITMQFRGFGLRVFGSEMMGGRFYFQQLICSIFPFLFAMIYVEEKHLVFLFALQCMFTATFLISDFIFSVAPTGLWVILQFFELPADAANFELQSRRFGIRRFQSLYLSSQGFILLLFLHNNLKEFLRRRSWYLLPILIGLISMGLLSGHRFFILIITITTFFCLYVQRFWNLFSTTVVAISMLMGILMLYTVSDRLPMAAQRAVSFMPGIQISQQARNDGTGTLITRSMLRKIGWQMIPEYFWIGRGFGMDRTNLSALWDPTGITLHVNQGRFYNGIIGLMVNTGIFGTLSMLLFLGSGTWLAWEIMQFLRASGCVDTFTRMCCVVSSLWMANVVAFIFFHGDSEYAMKTFALQAGVLIACRRHVERRRREYAEGSRAPVLEEPRPA